jgi:hypothetical protein
MVTKYKTAYAVVTGTEDYYLSPAMGNKLRILYGNVVCVMDATVIDRNLIARIQDKDGNQLWSSLLSGAQAASETDDVVINNKPMLGDYTDLDTIRSTAGIDNIIAITEPSIYDTDKFVLELINGQAGDSLTIRIKYMICPTNEDFHP